MKHQKFEIAVAGYDYRFKTYARDGVEASVKVKCFLGKPDAECTILVPAGALGQIRRRWLPPSNGALNCFIGI